MSAFISLESLNTQRNTFLKSVLCGAKSLKNWEDLMVSSRVQTMYEEFGRDKMCLGVKKLYHIKS